MSLATPIVNQPQPITAVQQVSYELMEKVLIDGDLSRLTSKERVTLYKQICESLNLNPLTRPFQYINFDGKLTLYASKNCTEQLRNLNGISIIKVEKETLSEGVFLYTAYAQSAKGQTDVGTGAVNIKGLAGKALANAYKIAETQAKRRVTLSICGLGWTDESEVDDIPNAERVEVDFETGDIIESVKVEEKVDALTLEFLDLQVAIEMADTFPKLKEAFTKAWKSFPDQDSRAQFKKSYDHKKIELDLRGFKDETTASENNYKDKEVENDALSVG